jgi:LysM repeat protein
MQFKTASCALFAVLVFALGLCGCLPSGQSQLDEEKESHYLAGKAKVNSLDYQGGLECFEKAIEANPRSGLAHFEAGLLCEKYKQDHAAAIYHFERFLEFRPDSVYAEVVRQHILACKQELARSVSLTPITQSLQKELETLSQENKMLREEVQAWRTQTRTQNTTGVIALSSPGGAAPAVSGTSLRSTPSSTNSLSHSITAPSGGRTHTIKPGDTPVSIARKYGVKVDVLLAANPRLNARRLQIGQSVIIPQQ